MLSCLLIKSHSRSEIALPFFQYNSTIITTIADSVRTVLVTVIQASAFIMTSLLMMSLNCCPPLNKACPPCKMNQVMPLGAFFLKTAERCVAQALNRGVGPRQYISE